MELLFGIVIFGLLSIAIYWMIRTEVEFGGNHSNSYISGNSGVLLPGKPSSRLSTEVPGQRTATPFVCSATTTDYQWIEFHITEYTTDNRLLRQYDDHFPFATHNRAITAYSQPDVDAMTKKVEEHNRGIQH